MKHPRVVAQKKVGAQKYGNQNKNINLQEIKIK